MVGFPICLRGYDRAAVEARLRELDDEVVALRAALAARQEPIATAASEQVRAVLAAAEASAAEIVRQAERDGRALREHEQSATHAERDRVARVVAAGAGVIERLDALRGELSELLGAASDSAAATPTPPTGRDAGAPAPASATEPAAAAELHVPESHAADPATAAPHAPEAPAAAPPAAEPDAAVADEDGARLVALDLALSGAPREQADRYLAEHFALGDRAALLDDVYAAVG